MIPRDLLKAPFEVVQAYLNAACEFIVSQPNYVPSIEPIEITPEADAKARETIGKKFSGQNPGESRGFCPTGKGGGIDNSCGREGSGGGAFYAKGDKMRRSDIKAKQRISIQKYGQQKVLTGTVQAVKHGKDSSEITLKGDDGKVIKVKIRNLASVTDQGGGKPTAKQESAAKGGRPTPPDSNSPQAVANYGREVQEYCKSMGVEVIGGKAMRIGALVKQAATVAAWSEVASGVELCVRAGIKPPEAIRLDDEDAGTFGWYNPRERGVVNVNSRLDPERINRSVKSGFLAGSVEGSIVVHETAHMLHDEKLRKGGGIGKGIAAIDDDSLPVGMYDLGRKHVSQYSSTHPAEFVAEVYTAHVSGKKMPKSVWNLYKKLGGPKPPKGYPR